MQIWSEESKMIIEFTNLLIELYEKKYGLDLSWISSKSEFIDQVQAYND